MDALPEVPEQIAEPQELDTPAADTPTPEPEPAAPVDPPAPPAPPAPAAAAPIGPDPIIDGTPIVSLHQTDGGILVQIVRESHLVAYEVEHFVARSFEQAWQKLDTVYRAHFKKAPR